MRKIILLLLLACSLSYAADVRRPGANVFTVLDRQLAWSTYASTGVSYVIDSVSVNTGVCLTLINNNPTNTRTVTAGFAITPDPYTTTYAGNTGKWVSASGAIQFSVPASKAQSFFFDTFGAAHIAILLSTQGGAAGGTPDTVDSLVVQGTACPNGATSVTPTQTSPTVTVNQNQWSISSGPIAVSTKASVSNAGIPGIRHTATCLQFSNIASTTTTCGPAEVVIRDGVCGSGTIMWNAMSAVPATTNQSVQVPICGLQLTGTAGNTMCAEFSVAQASCYQRVNLSGFDQ